MKGKTVVITGATSGIGRASALVLARLGARIVLVARDPARAEATLARLRQVAPDAEHGLHLADLSRLVEIRRVGAAIASAEPRIDVLVNNAGAWFAEREETEDGFEKTLALNHLGAFLLTELLRERLVAAAPARVITTSSVGHRYGRIDWSDLQSRRHYRGFEAYCRSKLCNILFTRGLAVRLAGTGVTANCFHPGFVASRFGDGMPGLTGLAFNAAKSLFAISPEKGAETLVFLASDRGIEGSSGGYYVGSKALAPSAAARDDVSVRHLWDASTGMTQTDAPSPSL